MNLFEKLKIYAKRDIKYRNYIDLHRYRLKELSSLYKNNKLDEFKEIIESDIDPIEGFNEIFDRFYGQLERFLYRFKSLIEKKYGSLENFLNIEDENVLENIEKIDDKKEEEKEECNNVIKKIDIEVDEDSNRFSFEIEEADNKKFLVIYRDDIIIESFDDFITDLGTNLDENFIYILKAVKIDNRYYKVGKMGNSNGFSYEENKNLFEKVVNKFIKEYLDDQHR